MAGIKAPIPQMLLFLPQTMFLELTTLFYLKKPASSKPESWLPRLFCDEFQKPTSKAKNLILCFPTTFQQCQLCLEAVSPECLSLLIFF